MEENYSSKYSGALVDAAVEYFLNHSLSEEDSYEYTNTIFCESTSTPSSPFNSTSLPTVLPEFPFAGTDGKLWYDLPNTTSKNWYQCTLRLNSKTNKVVSQGTVINMSGDKGDTGDKGSDGTNGSDGNNGTDGTNGNYTEFRYKRADAYAIILTETQKTSRYPEGWSKNWDDTDNLTWEELKDGCCNLFGQYIIRYSGITTASADNSLFFTTGGKNPSYSTIASIFKSLYGTSLTTNATLQEAIVACYKDFATIYFVDTSTVGDDQLSYYNQLYHKAWTSYVDEDHKWLLFLILATIDGTHDTLIGEWSTPNRLLGEDGKPGPSGSNGISGIPGVSIGVAFALGDESWYKGENPLNYPYNTHYSSLFATGTGWSKTAPTVTDSYPYIWFTQCRYILTQDESGNDVYTFEDTWSAPKRYTGLNGITIHETITTRNPIIYPAGIFSLNTSYSNDGVRTPYVYYNGNYYYLSGLGVFTSDSESNNPASASSWWTLMEHFSALFAEVGIIANGLVGSAVFNGDYMFSLQGTDYWGNTSTHYELFLTHYSTGAALTNPYDTYAAFKPNFCINFKTGEFVSTSVSNSITNTKSEIKKYADNISLLVSEDVDGKLRSAGINITSSGTYITGNLSGSMDGTFKGEVAAKSLKVLYEDGTTALQFATYKDSMGTPDGGTAPEEGTPVLLINYGGNQYLVSMLKLVTGGSTGSYLQTRYVEETLYATSSVACSISVQSSLTYKCITTAPYLTFINNDGSTSSLTIAAKLYNYAGTEELEWSDYIGKYYSGTLVTEYSDKTALSEGVWAFRVTGSLATRSDIYLGTPSTKTIALYVGGVNGYPAFSSQNSYVFLGISITSGVLKTTGTNIAVVKYAYINSDHVETSDSACRYIQIASISSAYRLTGSTLASSATTSSYFMSQTTSSTTVTTTQLNNSYRVAVPPPPAPNA